MRADRIAELLEPFLLPIYTPYHSEPGRRPGEEPAVLSATQLRYISTYIDILLHWNARINLTAIRNPEEIITRHFGESIFAARHLFPRDWEGQDFSPEPAISQSSALDGANSAPRKNSALAPEGSAEARVADLGSGAGFPGIPVKIWAPNIALTLIESNHKKATFLREAAREIGLEVNVQNVRAESLPAASFDKVTIRAVERLFDILSTATRLLVPSGTFALLIGSAQVAAVQSALSDVRWLDPIPVPVSDTRTLLIASKEP